jgi:hypothetical protein
VTTPYNEALGSTLIDRTFRERIVLVGVTLPGSDDEATEAGLDELERLVETAGADVVARLMQRRDAPDHTWFIGKGKAEELRTLCLAVDADTVVFDNELHPAQQFNLEKLLGRTATSSLRMPEPKRAAPRLNLRSCGIDCRDSGVDRARNSPSSAVVSALASVAVRPNSRSIDAGSIAESEGLRSNCVNLPKRGVCSARVATVAVSLRSRLWDIRMLASQRC